MAVHPLLELFLDQRSRLHDGRRLHAGDDVGNRLVAGANRIPEPWWLQPLGMLLQTIESFALSIQEHRQQRRPEKVPQRDDPMSGHELDSQMLVYFADQVREALESEPEDRSV